MIGFLEKAVLIVFSDRRHLSPMSLNAFVDSSSSIFYPLDVENFILGIGQILIVDSKIAYSCIDAAVIKSFLGQTKGSHGVGGVLLQQKTEKLLSVCFAHPVSAVSAAKKASEFIVARVPGQAFAMLPPEDKVAGHVIAPLLFLCQMSDHVLVEVRRN